jgi:hypothetical protein
MTSRISEKKTLNSKNSNTLNLETNYEISEESYIHLVKLDFYFNGKKISFELSTDNHFQDIYDELKKKLEKNLNLDKYDIIYKLQKISFDEETLISDIVSYEDKNPSFILRKKPQFTVPISYKHLTVSIENFPSFMDLSEQINKFLSNFEIDIDFDVNYFDNCCKITFVKSEIAFSFINYMTKIKFNNNYYKHVKINLHYKFVNNNKEYNKKSRNKSYIFHNYVFNLKNDKKYINEYNNKSLFINKRNKNKNKNNLLKYLDNTKSIHFNDRYYNSLFTTNKNYNTINTNLDNEINESEDLNFSIQQEKEIYNFHSKRNSKISKPSKKLLLNLPKINLDTSSINTVEYDLNNSKKEKKRYFRFRTGKISDKFSYKDSVQY